MNSYIAKLICDILQIIVFLLGSYYLIIAFFSYFSFKKNAKYKNDYTFSVIIPAHNEADVLPELLKSIKNCNYQKNLIKTFVIADECSDRTVQIAKKFGSEVIVKDISISKGTAISYALKLYEERLLSSDCVVFFDADNIVDVNYFSELCEKFSSGSEVVQGYVDSKNPNSSWVSNAHSIWYWITNRIFQNGRSELSLGCHINGTGFAVRSSVLKQVPFNPTTVAEDLEYTCELEMADIKVDFAPKAIVYDEKPTTFTDSVNQRLRWSVGIGDVQERYSFLFLKSGKYNAFLGLWSNVLSLFAFLILLISKIFSLGYIWSSPIGSLTVLIYLFSCFTVVFAALIKDKKMNKNIFLNMFGFLIYVISWVPIGLFCRLSQKNKNWYHTKHTNDSNY